MVKEEYANAYCEVLEILKYIPKEEYNKIPTNKIKFFEINKNNDYYFLYNPQMTLDENGASKITKGIIAILFKNYWATEKQREKILLKQQYDIQKLEEEKREKYNPDNIFKKNEEENRGTIKNNLPMEIKKENSFKKLINYMKNLFKRW